MAIRTAMDDALEQAVESGSLPGVVALAADANGVIYQGAFGKRAVGGAVEMTLDTVFFIASMTKAITSVAAMQLVERGEITLEEPLGARFPELVAPQVLEGFDTAGAPILRPARRPITLRHLLTHTAGYSGANWNGSMQRYLDMTAEERARGGDRAMLHSPLVFDPGDGWEYGLSTDWVGQVVEMVSGKRLDLYVEEQIAGPLGMTDTKFFIGPDQEARKVSMHRRHPDGSLEAIPWSFAQTTGFVRGAGGLHSTGPDYLRFVQMLVGQGTREGVQILKSETVADMARNQMGEITMPVMRTVAPLTSNDFEPFPGIVTKWGLGFAINTETGAGGRSACSLAWGGIANTYFWIDPAKRLGGLIMTQILPFADRAVLDTFTAFERAVYGL
ncbi:MAG: serine hydrolase domain-containing protein [Chloroflexota bacterium]